MMMVLTDEQSELAEKLHKEYYALFYSLAYKILRSESAAEDAVNTAFVKIMDIIEEISKKSRPRMKAYCVVIVENSALEMLRRDKRMELVESLDQDMIDEAATPDEIAISTVEQEKVRELLDDLPDDEQEILKLHYYNELSYKKIAELYDISVDAAKKRGQRAIVSLRKLMNSREKKGR